jgi:hypothetical protein
LVQDTYQWHAAANKVISIRFPYDEGIYWLFENLVAFLEGFRSSNLAKWDFWFWFSLIHFKNHFI